MSGRDRAAAAVLLVFGLIALGHVLMLAVRRRRHELAVLRAIGWRPGEASSTIRWQAGTIALLALVFGVPAGLVIGRLLWVAIAERWHAPVSPQAYDQLSREMKPDEIEKAKAAAAAYTFKTK